MNDTLQILLIEDNPGDATLLQEMLKESTIRYELKCVERLSAGIVLLNEVSFNVILLDLGLPDSYGLETLIKLNESAPVAPIIVLTSLANEEIGIQAVKNGAQDYLIKGQIDHNLLSRSIRYAIERKQSSEIIQAAAREWSVSFDAMSDGVSIHSADHTILNANQTLYNLLGKSADKVIGKKCYEIFHGKECSISNCPMNKTSVTRLNAYTEIYEPTLNKWLAVSTSPIIDNLGKLIRIVHTIRDITEQKKLEEQLRQSQKMESIGTLAGGIAHDFNNILTAIIGYAQITLMKMSLDDPLRHHLSCILEGSDRANSLTKQLLLFSRKQACDMKPMDLNTVINQGAKFLRMIISEDIEFRTELREALPPVLVDEHQLEQVLMNLGTNARDAMPHGGTFTVATEMITLDEAFIATHGYGQSGAYALLSVSDTGAGMDKETQQRIFEPFFSTKEVGKGTGLGLAVVYGIIKQHDGFITVYSEPGEGSNFRIYLPLTSAVRPVTGTQQQQPVTGGTETILLAEDDELVRGLVTSVLTEAGYRVIVAVDGVEAVRKFKENAGSIQLLLFDLIMPKMNGKEAADEIHKLQPEVKTIFSSGYSPDIVHRKASLNNGSHLITKPVAPRDLLQKVRDVMDGARS